MLEGTETHENTDDAMVGRVIAHRYRILEQIATGGMGAIYRARQEQLDRIVALKLLHGGPNLTESAKKRFTLEASAAARLSHSNTVRVFDFGITDDGLQYIAMELVDGVPLTDLLRHEAPMAPARALHITRQIVSALAAAHARGIIHRDIKPENVLITHNGEDNDFVKVVDFGLVKVIDADESATRTGHIVGSPHYMPPEQIEGLTETDHRSDMYPVGILMFNMLTGRRPYKRKGTTGLLYAHAHDPFPWLADIDEALHVPGSVEMVMRQCVQKNPADRFDTMRDLARALDGCEDDVFDLTAPLYVMDPAEGPVDDYGRRFDSLKTNGGFNDTASHTTSAIVAGAVSATVTTVLVGAVLITLGVALPSISAGSKVAEAEPEAVVEAIEQPTAVVTSTVENEDAEGEELAETEDSESEQMADDSEATDAAERPEAAPKNPVPAAPARAANRPRVAPAAATGRVVVKGDARSVWLERGGKTFDVSRPVPVGQYTVKAWFDAPSPVDAGEVEIRAGDNVTLKCLSFVSRCK